MVNSWVNWGWSSYYHHHYHQLSTYFHYQIEYNPLPSSVKIGFTHHKISTASAKGSSGVALVVASC